jgi:transmembrane sensor
MPEFNEISDILAKYPDITTEEQHRLNEWLNHEQNEEIYKALTNNENRIALLEELHQMKMQDHRMWEQFHARNFSSAFPLKSKTVWWHSWPTYMAAACIIIIAIIGGLKWWGTNKNDTLKPPAVVAQKNDVQPGSFKARLTLGDGSVVDLDSFSKKQLEQGSTTVYTKDGQLVYQPQGKQEDKILYNTLTTAKGQMYATVLADGSKVWLNSQSSIRYPVSFSQDRREVEITGEAYFEVAKMKDKPFIVKAEGVEVEVLGTQFNINTYSDEETIKTTLLEGKVKMHATASKSLVILQPGQQGSLDMATHQLRRIVDVDVEEAVAWRFGYFQFNDTELKAVLSQVARWYDVEVIYQGSIPQKKFWGKISRSNTLSQVIVAIEKYGVHCNLQGRKLIVSL